MKSRRFIAQCLPCFRMKGIARLPLLHCGIFDPTMSAMCHQRPRRSKPHGDLCPLRPESGQIVVVSLYPLSAKSGHSHCSKKHRYSITSSARAMRLGGYVETDRFGGGEVDDKLRLGGLLATAAQPETEPHVPAAMCERLHLKLATRVRRRRWYLALVSTAA